MLEFISSAINFLKPFISSIFNTTASIIPPKNLITVQNKIKEKVEVQVMEIVTLVRGASTDDGTFGKLTVSGKTFISEELPWRDNKSNISCIPTGTYTCEVTFSNRFQRDLYQVNNVENRNSVRIHPANWAGDTFKGKKSDLEGCIGLGEGISVDDKGQKIIIDSKIAIADFMATLNNQPFTLIISNA